MSAPVSKEESRWLYLIARGGLIKTFIREGVQYSAAGVVVPTKLAEKLIRSRAVLADSPGLFEGDPQAWRARRPADGPA